MNIIDALKLIITRSPNASHEAMTTIRAVQIGSPVTNRRYAYCLEIAFNDPEAQFSQQERTDLISCLSTDKPESKSEMIALRLSPTEYDFVKANAEREEQSISDYIRSKIL